MKTFNAGTLYDMNKQLMKNERKMYKAELNNKVTDIVNFISSHSNKYFMLLCNECKDYTLFNIKENNEFLLEKEIKTCLKNRGDILSIDKVDNAFEIWIKINDECFCYYLFPYDVGVIEIN